MAETDDNARLAAIKERVAKATEGPWYVSDGCMFGFDGEWDVTGPDNCGIASMAGTAPVAKFPRNKEANAEFIAANREDIPWLLDHTEQLQRERDELRKLMQQEVQRCENYMLMHPQTVPSDCLVAVMIGLQFALDPVGMEAKAQELRTSAARDVAKGIWSATIGKQYGIGRPRDPDTAAKAAQ